MGNISAKKKAYFNSPSKKLEIYPATDGPIRHPASPARAKSANIATPPVGKFSDAVENVPGHITPTDKPHIAHPQRATMGLFESAAIR